MYTSTLALIHKHLFPSQTLLIKDFLFLVDVGHELKTELREKVCNIEEDKERMKIEKRE